MSASISNVCMRNRVEPEPEPEEADMELGDWLDQYIESADLDKKTTSFLNKRKGFWSYVKGDSLTKSGKRIQTTTLMTLIIIPIISLVVLSTVPLKADVDKFASDKKIVDILVLGTEVGDVIHYLQRERDLTAFYINRSIRGSASRIFIVSTYPLTDKAIEKIDYWPFGKDDIERAKNKAKFQMELATHRSLLDSKDTSPYDEINFYSEIIGSLVDWLSRAIQLHEEGDNWPSLIAYKLIIEATEDIGIQRSLGGVFFFNGGFMNTDEKLWYVEKYVMSTERLELAERFHTGTDLMYIDGMALHENVNITSIEQMHDTILGFNGMYIEASEVKSTWWFDNMTTSLLVYFKIQISIRDSILLSLNETLDGDWTKVTTSTSVLCIVAILSPLIINSVHTILSNTQRISRTLALQARALERERSFTMSLVYQMLPPTVADSLKQNRPVEAEVFTAVSICFIDIVGFTQISAACSPNQVVKMLTNIYSCFDDRIGLYDVYKIATIGDAYLVASGVPKRIGNRHASEISSMALDLNHHIKHIDVAHLKGKKIHVRIGIHSGPVVAGVVGATMPRYCIFGETVNIAGDMEANSLEDRIHISSVTKKILENSTQFEVVPRCPGEIENACSANSPPQTFWLISKVDMYSTFQCYPTCDLVDRRQSGFSGLLSLPCPSTGEYE